MFNNSADFVGFLEGDECVEIKARRGGMSRMGVIFDRRVVVMAWKTGEGRTAFAPNAVFFLWGIRVEGGEGEKQKNTGGLLMKFFRSVGIVSE
jgi:hypothetical protein